MLFLEQARVTAAERVEQMNDLLVQFEAQSFEFF
jgi:hypothetical protein